jgi:hypothetical protein
MKKKKTAPLYRVDVANIEAPEWCREWDADHHETVSTFIDVTPAQLESMLAQLSDDGDTFIDVFLQWTPSTRACDWMSEPVWTGAPSKVRSALGRTLRRSAPGKAQTTDAAG